MYIKQKSFHRSIESLGWKGPVIQALMNKSTCGLSTNIAQIIFWISYGSKRPSSLIIAESRVVPEINKSLWYILYT